jgi:hypothetical protein
MNIKTIRPVLWVRYSSKPQKGYVQVDDDLYAEFMFTKPKDTTDWQALYDQPQKETLLSMTGTIKPFKDYMSLMMDRHRELIQAVIKDESQQKEELLLAINHLQAVVNGTETFDLVLKK